MSTTILITGAGSGLGHGFAQHYLRQPNTTVITADVTYRLDLSPPDPPAPNTTLHRLTVDISSQNSIAHLITTIKSLLQPTHPHLDLIIHSAGIRGLVPTIESAQPDDVAAAETLAVMDVETLMRTYQVNTVGTFLLLQQLYIANLFHPASLSPSPTSNSNSNSNSDGKNDAPFTKVILMTSRMGSISHNTTSGGGYAYRASKAALNAMVRSMCVDVPGVVFALVHPGRVETGLTRCREEGAIEVAESVRDVLGVIEGLGRGDSGRFVDRFGVEIGW